MMENYILEILSRFSYIGIFFLIFIENIFPPIPSELILVFGGFISKKLNLSFFMLVIFSTLGSCLGAMLLYYLGKKISKERLDDFFNKGWVKKLGFKVDSVNKSLKYFNRYNSLAVFIGRCIPVVRSLISIPAGMEQMNFKKFIVYTGVGSLIWNTLLIYVGRIMEEKWKEGVAIVEKYSTIILFLLILFFVGKHFLKKIINKRGKNER